VESCLDRYAAAGIREVVVDPIGFVCDHVETSTMSMWSSATTPPSAASEALSAGPKSLNGSPGRSPPRWPRWQSGAMRVVIIGGGISGLSAAYYLAKGGGVPPPSSNRGRAWAA
jgi:hypothetical protein